MWEKFLLCSIFYFVVWTQSEKMSKSGSEETLEKLKALIEKAQKQKVDLKSLKPIEKLGKLLKEDNKLLISCLFFLLLAVYGTSGQLFLTEKVNLIKTFCSTIYKGLIFSAGFQIQKILGKFSENLITVVFVKELDLV